MSVGRELTARAPARRPGSGPRGRSSGPAPVEAANTVVDARRRRGRRPARRSCRCARRRETGSSAAAPARARRSPGWSPCPVAPEPRRGEGQRPVLRDSRSPRASVPLRGRSASSSGGARRGRRPRARRGRCAGRSGPPVASSSAPPSRLTVVSSCAGDDVRVGDHEPGPGDPARARRPRARRRCRARARSSRPPRGRRGRRRRAGRAARRRHPGPRTAGVGSTRRSTLSSGPEGGSASLSAVRIADRWTARRRSRAPSPLGVQGDGAEAPDDQQRQRGEQDAHRRPRRATPHRRRDASATASRCGEPVERDRGERAEQDARRAPRPAARTTTRRRRRAAPGRPGRRAPRRRRTRRAAARSRPGRARSRPRRARSRRATMPTSTRFNRLRRVRAAMRERALPFPHGHRVAAATRAGPATLTHGSSRIERERLRATERRRRMHDPGDPAGACWRRSPSSAAWSSPAGRRRARGPALRSTPGRRTTSRRCTPSSRPRRRTSTRSRSFQRAYERAASTATIAALTRGRGDRGRRRRVGAPSALEHARLRRPLTGELALPVADDLIAWSAEPRLPRPDGRRAARAAARAPRSARRSSPPTAPRWPKGPPRRAHRRRRARSAVVGEVGAPSARRSGSWPREGFPPGTLDRDHRARAGLQRAPRRAARRPAARGCAARRASSAAGACSRPASRSRARPCARPSTPRSRRRGRPRSASLYGGVAVLDARNGRRPRPRRARLLGAAAAGLDVQGDHRDRRRSTPAIVTLDDEFPVETSNSDDRPRDPQRPRRALRRHLRRELRRLVQHGLRAARRRARRREAGRDRRAASASTSRRRCSTPRRPRSSSRPRARSRRTSRRRVEVGESAIGQGEVLATPLRWRPSRRRSPTGGVRLPTAIARSDPSSRRDAEPVEVTSPETAATMRDLMIEVVSNGTGIAAALPGDPGRRQDRHGRARPGGARARPGARHPARSRRRRLDAWFTRLRARRRPGARGRGDGRRLRGRRRHGRGADRARGARQREPRRRLDASRSPLDIEDDLAGAVVGLDLELERAVLGDRVVDLEDQQRALVRPGGRGRVGSGSWPSAGTSAPTSSA